MATVRDSFADRRRRARDAGRRWGQRSTLPPSGRPVGRHRRPASRGAGWGPRLELAILIGPALVVFVAFVIFPVVLAAYYGFFSWNGLRARRSTSSACATTSSILTDPAFHEALGHNVFIVVMSLVMQGPIALGPRAAAQPQDARPVGRSGC